MDRTLTLLFQKHTAFCDDNRHVSVNVAASILVDERDGDVGVRDALSEGDAEDPLGSDTCWNGFSMTAALRGWTLRRSGARPGNKTTQGRRENGVEM